MSDSPVKQRIKKFIDYKGISTRQFCLSIGVSPSFVANISKSIQPDKVNSISNQYPDLNAGWLLTGEGEMLKGATEKSDQKISEQMNFSDFLEALQKSHDLLAESLAQNARLIGIIERMQGISPAETRNSPPLVFSEKTAE